MFGSIIHPFTTVLSFSNRLLVGLLPLIHWYIRENKKNIYHTDHARMRAHTQRQREVCDTPSELCRQVWLTLSAGWVLWRRATRRSTSWLAFKTPTAISCWTQRKSRPLTCRKIEIEYRCFFIISITRLKAYIKNSIKQVKISLSKGGSRRQYEVRIYLFPYIKLYKMKLT